jgi:hypothetical protein
VNKVRAKYALAIGILIVIACYLANFSRTAKAAGNVTISHQGFFDSVNKYYWVAGEVKNVGDTPVTNITVTANFYDASNTFINSSTTYILPGTASNNNPWALMPGSKAPFWPIMLPSQSGSNNVDHYNATVTFQECASIPVGLQLTLTNVTVYPMLQGADTLYVEGTVKNSGTSNATWVYVYATAYDASGVVIGYNEWDKQDLAANAETSFHITTTAYGINTFIQPAKHVATYTVTAQSFLQPLYYVTQYGVASDTSAAIPEFPSELTIVLLMMALTAVLIMRKKQKP